VGLVRDVRDQIVGHLAGECLAGARERGEVRRRAAADQQTGRLGGVADPVLEPLDHLELEPAGPGRLHPGAGEDVARAGDEVAERARPRAGEGNEGEEARVVAAARERQDVLLEAAEDLFEVLRLVGRGAVQPPLHLVGARSAERRDRVIGEPVDEHVDGAVAELPHRLGIETQRVVVQGTPSSADAGRILADLLMNAKASRPLVAIAAETRKASP
jgi:hypothetical protein